MLCRRVQKQQGEGEDGGCVHGRGVGGGRDILGSRRWWGCPCKLTLWPRSVNTYTHTYACLEVETGKQAKKGGENCLLKPFWAVYSQSKIPKYSSLGKVREERSRCVVAINTTGCDGFLNLPWFQNRFLFVSVWTETLTVLEIKVRRLWSREYRKLIGAISLWYTVKGCYSKVNCREGEGKHTHTYTYGHTEGSQQTLPKKKGQKGQKKNKNKVNTVKT